MMDIEVTYDNGTTELRDGDSYVHWLPPSRLAGRGITWRERVNIATDRAAELWQMRDAPSATVWRTTWDADTKVLSGAWVSCRVETMVEQIERLTRERDATARHLTEAVVQAIALRDAEHRRAEAERVRADIGDRDRRLLCSEMEETEAALKAAVAPTWHEADDRPLTSAEQVTAIAARVENEKARADATAKDLSGALAWATKVNGALRLTTQALSQALGPTGPVEREVLTRTVAAAASALAIVQPGVTLDIATVCARLVGAERAAIEAERCALGKEDA